jgi:hypothetical protein
MIIRIDVYELTLNVLFMCLEKVKILMHMSVMSKHEAKTVIGNINLVVPESKNKTKMHIVFVHLSLMKKSMHDYNTLIIVM